MKIRSEQLRQLDEAAGVEFHRRLAAFLRRELPDATGGLSDGELLRLVEESERRAARHGITSERGVAQFACLTFAAGPRFDQEPPIRDYLAGGGDPEEKLEALIDELAALDGKG